MKEQDALAYLESYAEAQRDIIDKTDELKEWRCFMEKITPTLSGMPGGSHDNTSKVERGQMQVDSLIRDIERELNKARTTRKEVLECIGNMPTASYRTLLKREYTRACTLKQIAMEEGQTVNAVRLRHKRAIKEFCRYN